MKIVGDFFCLKINSIFFISYPSFIPIFKTKFQSWKTVSVLFKKKHKILFYNTLMIINY